MDGKQLRQTFSYGFLTLYILYGLFGIGMTGLLFSFAVGLIITSMDQPIELVVAGTILSGLIYKVIAERRRKEGFQVPLGAGQDAKSIVKKVEEIQQKNVFQPSGVLSSNFVEGFADVPSAETNNNAGSEKASAAGQKTPPPSESTPASVAEKAASSEMAKALPTSNAAAAAMPSPTNTEKPKATQEPVAVAAGFADKNTDGMFKLGSIPAEAVGGAHIDVGTTLMNALNALKPDQVKAMTDDTRKLMETQKSLMGMLTTMKPMIQDGRQLMETFTEMFGKQ
jgi:hypothetical protein